jgi:hypothetical protein
MPLNGFSVGRDVALTIVTAKGPLTLNLITAFTCEQDTSDQMVKGLDGVPRPIRHFNGWRGRFELERADSTLDDYFAGLEADIFSGLSEQPATLTETIAELSGAVSQYRFTGVLLKLDGAGEWRGDQAVRQSLSFIASRRIKVS